MVNSQNIGEIGIQSIRIGGMKIADLPIAEQHYARKELPLAIDTQRQNKIDNVLAGYPTQKCAYLRNRITECEDNARRITASVSQQKEMLGEYSGLLSMCKQRDKKLQGLDEEKDWEQIAKLKKQFPPYDLEALASQIKQCTDALERADEVIAAEYASIAEVRGVLQLCEKRDAELKDLGARVANG